MLYCCNTYLATWLMIQLLHCDVKLTTDMFSLHSLSSPLIGRAASFKALWLAEASSSFRSEPQWSKAPSRVHQLIEILLLITQSVHLSSPTKWNFQFPTQPLSVRYELVRRNDILGQKILIKYTVMMSLCQHWAGNPSYFSSKNKNKKAGNCSHK